ncbi:hypothetical protein BJ742DRAFT_577057 [Cladochytrium replicatum]|nr:hypothetical protein BJ742DRAFT_577057 [Cladochytrium replicatum]
MPISSDFTLPDVLHHWQGHSGWRRFWRWIDPNKFEQPTRLSLPLQCAQQSDMLFAATAHSGRQLSTAPALGTKGAVPAGSYQNNRNYPPPSTSDGRMVSEDGVWRLRTKGAEQIRPNDVDSVDGRKDRWADVKNRQGIKSGSYLMSAEWGRHDVERHRSDTYKNDFGERVEQSQFSSGMSPKGGLRNTEFKNRHQPVMMTRLYNGGAPGTEKMPYRETKETRDLHEVSTRT